MHIPHRKLVVGLAAGLAAVSGGAAALASSGAPSPPVLSRARTSAVVAPSQSVVDAFPVFRTPEQASYIAGQQRLKAGFDRGDANHFSDTDFSLARPVPIAGSNAQAWVAPSGDHVCVFIPDPTEGYGAVCSSLAEIEEGKADIAALVDPRQDGDSGPLHGNAIVAVLTPNGTVAPDLVSAAGKTPLDVHNNLAAAEVPAAETVTAAQGAQAVLSTDSPSLNAGP
jgi:hypothetical protein